MTITRPDNPPELPALVRKPLSLLPPWIAMGSIQRALNVVFANQLKSGELEFLQGRIMDVCITDAPPSFRLTVARQKIRVTPAVGDTDLQISGTTYAFLQLATRAEDSDTLFFRRQLRTTGDTELGLYLKNFLESMDPDAMPLQPALGRLLEFSLYTANTVDALQKRISKFLPGS